MSTANQAATQIPTPALVADSVPSPTDTETPLEVPPEFRKIDFKNFSYQTNLRGKIHLNGGKREYPEGGGGALYDLKSVGFADLAGDARKEAVVQLIQVSCGVSCDGGSHLFYFYRLGKHGPSLFWRIETGSLGYRECGLKAFELVKKGLTLEVFQTCRLQGTKFQPTFNSDEDDKNCVGKYSAQTFTSFEFEFRNGKVIPRKRKVLPFPQCDIGNHHAPFNIFGN